jgi:hypothetical protein
MQAVSVPGVAPSRGIVVMLGVRFHQRAWFSRLQGVTQGVTGKDGQFLSSGRERNQVSCFLMVACGSVIDAEVPRHD